MTITTKFTFRDLPATGLTGVTGIGGGDLLGDNDMDLLVEVSGTEAKAETFKLNVDRADLNIARGLEDKIIVTHKTIDDVVVTMKDVERLVLNDTAIAFDVDEAAGEMLALLSAAYGQDDVTPNLMGMALYLKDQGKTDVEIAKVILASDSYKQDAMGVSNETFVKQIFKNVTGSGPSFSDLLFWTTELDKGTYSQAQLLEAASNLDFFRDEDHIDIIGVYQTGIQYTPYVGQ